MWGGGRRRRAAGTFRRAGGRLRRAPAAAPPPHARSHAGRGSARPGDGVPRRSGARGCGWARAPSAPRRTPALAARPAEARRCGAGRSACCRTPVAARRARQLGALQVPRFRSLIFTSPPHPLPPPPTFFSAFLLPPRGLRAAGGATVGPGPEPCGSGACGV